MTTVTWPDSAKIVFGYDSYGRRTTVTDPDGNVTAYSYANTSTNKGLSSVAHSVAGGQALGTIAFNRDARGRLASLTGPYGMTQEWSYDSHSRNTGFTVSSYLTGGVSSPLHAESYTYDALDRRTRVDYPVQTGAGGATAASRREWGYDAAGRLVREDRFGGGGTGSGTARTYGRVWGYDNAGNRSQELYFDGSTTSTDSAPTFNAWNQRTADGRENELYWDDEGNLTSKASSELAFYWDRRNRLVEVQGPFPRLGWESVYYGYDPSGRLINRVAKDPQDPEFGWYDEKRYYADSLSPILVKRRHRYYGESPAVIQPWHTWKAALIIPGVIGHVTAERETTAWNPSTGATTSFTDRYYHYDPLGNCVLETGANAVVLARTDMEAYGEIVRESDASGNWAVASSSVGPTGDVGAGSRPRQTTKETDPDTGLRWFGARWYDPQMGSWINAEPLGLDGPNLYWFSRDHVTEAVDYNGRDTHVVHYPTKWSHRMVCFDTPDGSIMCYELNARRYHEIAIGKYKLDYPEYGLGKVAGRKTRLSEFLSNPDVRVESFPSSPTKDARGIKWGNERCEKQDRYYLFPILMCWTFADEGLRNGELLNYPTTAVPSSSPTGPDPSPYFYIN